ncbi:MULTISPECIES: hypothetical protein [Flavobacteriaceae]|uniref:Uncharacterized protein n=2 Tax=Flavobacteriaceae TaxID=49546 RepID=A0A4Y8ARY9_9FLAO|nr:MULTISPECIES: hypothetical protein [Flavobacteriaceae]TEW73010.1 hypothetical protein E2488_12525 [Gramella jeungdoensis]GGK47810.1 hypothetical protein GCM10007963_15090 [Lutibacter litoralis]
MAPNKRYLIIILFTFGILLIPLLAMQFTIEVNWGLLDFIVAGIFLLGTGFVVDFVIRKVSKLNYKIAIITALLTLLFLFWAELAVGIFGTPFTGN